MTTPTVRFKRLVIEELFGPGSNRIDIQFRLDERITVLHGRNGSGKTITLELIAALREGRYGQLRRYPFKQLSLELSDGSTLVIEPVSKEKIDSGKSLSKKQRRRSEDIGLQYVLHRPDGHDEGPLTSRGELSDLRKSRLEALFRTRGIRRIGSDAWLDPTTLESLTSDELIERYPSLIAEIFMHSVGERVDEPPSLVALRECLPPVKFIRTDRLFTRGDEESRSEMLESTGRAKPRLMVEHLSQKIQALVKQADQQYRLTSTRLDASLPQRLFKPISSEVPELDVLRTRSKSLREREARLHSLGLLKPQQGGGDEATLTSEQRGAFFIILSDREEKLAPFSELADKAQRLLESLGKKLHPKQIRLNVETGYQVITPSGASLPLDQLSSGEQHELVLLHELLFDVQPETLILIDEPELSLHIAWQSDMLPELLEVAALSRLDFVLATHSPYIVGDHHADLLVCLGVFL